MSESPLGGCLRQHASSVFRTALSCPTRFCILLRHSWTAPLSSSSRDGGGLFLVVDWIPTFAGMSKEKAETDSQTGAVQLGVRLKIRDSQ